MQHHSSFRKQAKWNHYLIVHISWSWRKYHVQHHITPVHVGRILWHLSPVLNCVRIYPKPCRNILSLVSFFGLQRQVEEVLHCIRTCTTSIYGIYARNVRTRMPPKMADSNGCYEHAPNSLPMQGLYCGRGYTGRIA